jgi:hypothetical protein
MAAFFRLACASSALIALGACAESLPAGSTAQPSTVTVAPSTVPAPGVVVVPPAALATPPVAAAPVVVPGSGTTLAPVLVPARLSPAELTALMADNTVAGVASNGRPYFVLFARDGRLKFRQDDFRDGGSWRVTSDGRLCSTLTRINVGVEECYSIYRSGSNFRYDRPDGNQIGTFAVQPGNPQNL